MTELLYLPVEQLRIHPKNIRLYYPDDDIQEMATSIKKSGVLQALLITPTNEEGAEGQAVYYVVDGNMRLAAARTIVDCPPLKCEVIEQDSVQQLLTMLSTSHFHYPKDPISKARHYQRLREQEGYSVAEISAATGLSLSTIHNSLSLLEFDHTIQTLIAQRKLTGDINVARLLLRVPDPDHRRRLAERYAARKVSIKGITKSLAHVLKQYDQLAEQPDPIQKQKPRKVFPPVSNKNGKLNDDKLLEIANLHLCENCRLDGLGEQCYTCPGPYEVINHIVDLLPQNLLAETSPDEIVKEPA